MVFLPGPRPGKPWILITPHVFAFAENTCDFTTIAQKKEQETRKGSLFWIPPYDFPRGQPGAQWKDPNPLFPNYGFVEDELLSANAFGLQYKF